MTDDFSISGGRHPFDLDAVRKTAWPDRWMPEGEGERFDKEAFHVWWARLRGDFDHLPPDLCEQWVHRHWRNSPFDFLPLHDLTWRREVLTGDELLPRLYRAWGGPLDPQFDYDTFQRKGGADRHHTAVMLDAGTWDYPMIALETPFGVMDRGESRPTVRWVVVEGHQRHRYLNALHALGRPPAGPHAVFVISSPLVS